MPSVRRQAERSDYVSGAFAAFARLPSDGLSCGSCNEQWGWAAPVATASCCAKPKPKGRHAPPRSLRKRFASDASLNLTCAGFPEEGGVGDGGSSGVAASKYLLAVLSNSNQADERYELRRLLRTAAARERLAPHGAGALRTCFIFDPTPPHGGRRKPGQLCA